MFTSKSEEKHHFTIKKMITVIQFEIIKNTEKKLRKYKRGE